jgi:uncharacterized membrane protein
MRLALKTTSYGLTHIVVATGVAYMLTGNMIAAIGIGLIEPIIQTAVFSIHEYIWENPKGGASFALAKA